MSAGALGVMVNNLPIAAKRKNQWVPDFIQGLMILLVVVAALKEADHWAAKKEPS